jgi:hypothetical protein
MGQHRRANPRIYQPLVKKSQSPFPRNDPRALQYQGSWRAAPSLWDGSVINSKLVRYFWQILFTDFKGSFPQVTLFSIAKIPVPQNRQSLLQYHQISSLVDRMLDLHKQRAAAKTPHEQTALDRQITATDARIDRLVYDLYGLTEEEIRLVEGK